MKTETKQCSKCCEVKALDQFYKKRKDCKQCCLGKEKAYYEANREKILKQKKAYREANREKLSKQKKSISRSES